MCVLVVNLTLLQNHQHLDQIPHYHFKQSLHWQWLEVWWSLFSLWSGACACVSVCILHLLHLAGLCSHTSAIHGFTLLSLCVDTGCCCIHWENLKRREAIQHIAGNPNYDADLERLRVLKFSRDDYRSVAWNTILFGAYWLSSTVVDGLVVCVVYSLTVSIDQTTRWQASSIVNRGAIIVLFILADLEWTIFTMEMIWNV